MPIASKTPSQPKVDNRKDVLLLLLYSPGVGNDANEPVTGRTRLVKMLYLFKQEALQKFKQGLGIDESNFYEFFSWDFGPFSTQVYDDLNFFLLRGFVESSFAESETLPESEAEWSRWLGTTETELVDGTNELYREESFRLTDQGVVFTQRLYALLTDSQRVLLRTFKKRLVIAPLRSILRYVYTTYPESTTHSTIKDEILGDARF